MSQTEYQKITKNVKEKISNLDILLPSHYKVLFFDVAEHMNIPLDEKKVSDNMVTDDIVYEHTKALNHSAGKAVSAIETKDEALLMQVLQETRNLKKKINLLQDALYEDTLTKAYNRKWFYDNFLEDNREVFKNEGMLALIDMNYFKEINDNYGHISGDKVLMFVSAQLKRSGADVVRYGGDEFFVLFTKGESEKKALLTLHSIRENIIKKKIKIGEHAFKTSYSYGVVPFKVDDLFCDVLDLADSKMYQDKKKIKSRISNI